ncbi:thioredoxin domain-containing protein [Microbacterium sp. CIAB417]|uniref:DsbA family protein n=1 Tax=Microbacterium sp. CIAB417 TaxID=2860287 RepID=UPI001FACFC42|nr:thioredoxin domain-containing protein [Microbacterium sp. CIAB417]
MASTLLLGGCAAPQSTDEPEATATTGAGIPQGAEGAAHFDDLALVVGDGPIDVQVWVDPFCPTCHEFEDAAGESIADMVDDGDITYSIHLMNFLDRASQGSEYSTRAGSALTCVAVSQPDRLLDAVRAIFTAQPQEQTTGLSDDEIVDVLEAAGVEDITACVEARPYGEWVQLSNDSAIEGISGADLPSIEGTPTLIVDGTAFTGDTADADAVEDFIRGGQGD